VVIAINEFKVNLEQKYARTDARLTDFDQTRVGGFRLDPENSLGKQLRNLLGVDGALYSQKRLKKCR